jgi:hypothetical protein
MMGLDSLDDVGEDFSDDWAEKGKNNNYNDSNQNKNKRILYKTLAFFFRSKQHVLFTSFPFGMFFISQ